MNHPELVRLLQEVQQLRQRVGELEAERRGPQRPRRGRRAVVLVAAALAVVAGAAWANSVPCSNGIPFCFGPNDPARAVEVNANFAALKTWLEAKVGPTGTVASPNGTVTTSRVVTAHYAPSYADWNSFTTGAGGAGIINDNVNYRALMLVGNSSAGGARQVQVYDDLHVNGRLVQGGYEVACAAGEAGYHFGFCCRMNRRTGEAECKNGTTTAFSAWGGAIALFGASSVDNYSLSCMGHRGSANWPLCCRTNSAGTTECKVSAVAGPLAWTGTPNPW